MTVKSYGPTQIIRILIHVSFTLRNLINMGQLSPPLTIVILYIYNLFPCSYEMTAEIFGKQKVHSRVIRSGDDLSIYHILLFKAFQFFFFFLGVGGLGGGNGQTLLKNPAMSDRTTKNKSDRTTFIYTKKSKMQKHILLNYA